MIMREIKFRAKMVDSDEWMYGYLREVWGENQRNFVIAPGKRFEYDGYTDTEEDYVRPDTIGQFSGLKDKNGKEIYEGDILMCVGQRSDNYGKKYYRKVLFQNGSFCMIDSESMYDSSMYNHVINGVLGWEVAGNIYDNPELIKAKK